MCAIMYLSKGGDLLMFAQKLKRLRADKGINQIQLSEKMGVTQGTVGKWETNKRTPDVEMLRKISDYFEVPVDYLISDDEAPELLLLYRQLSCRSGLSEEDRDRLINEFSDTIDIFLRNKQNVKTNTKTS